MSNLDLFQGWDRKKPDGWIGCQSKASGFEMQWNRVGYAVLDPAWQ